MNRIGAWVGRRGGRSHSREEANGRTPVPFVVGMGRSGTTLLRLMLDAHPDMAIPPETHFIDVAATTCESASDPRSAFLETVTRYRTWDDFMLDAGRLRQAVEAIEPFDLGDALRAFYMLYASRFGKARWGDKTPPYVRRMPLLHDLLPEARFVHLIRDGRDVAISAKHTWFGANSIEQAARQWWMLIEAARNDAKALPHYLEIRYETLVSQPEPTLRQIADFIHLPWNPGMLDYYKTADDRMSEIYHDTTHSRDAGRIVRAEQRRAIHTMTTQPPKQERIGRWKHEMTADERTRFERIAGEMLRGLGYEVG